MSRRPKILYVHHGFGIGGAPISLSNLVRSVVNLDLYDVTVLFMKNSKATELFDDIDCTKIILNQPYFYFNHTSRWTQIWKVHMILLMIISWFQAAFYKVPKLLRSLKPDLVHLNSSVLTDWSYAAYRLNVKNIVHIREAVSYGHFGIRYKLLKYLLTKFATAKLFISHENIDRLGLKESDSSIIVYNDVGETFLNAEKNAFNQSESLKCLFLGGISDIKGLHVLENACSDLDENIELHIAGHFNPQKALEKFPKLNRPQVKIIGLIKNVAEYMKRMDLLLCPITDTHFCRPAVEAAALAIPTIISDIEGAEEMVNNKKTGLHFENGNAQELAEKINFLNRNRKELHTLGKNAKLYFNEKFSPSVGFNKVIKLYNTLLN